VDAAPWAHRAAYLITCVRYAFARSLSVRAEKFSPQSENFFTRLAHIESASGRPLSSDSDGPAVVRGVVDNS
jgi:hypothetical protein